MAGLKEIDRRRKSVANTRKITYAMKLVSAAKLKKAQDSVARSRQYTDALYQLLAKLGSGEGATEFAHPLMEQRAQVKRVLLIVAGGGRGLCGGYNSNLNKKIDAFYKEKATAVEIDAVIMGKKPAEHFRRLNRAYVQSFEQLPEEANRWPIEEVCRLAEQGFTEGKYDEVHLVYTKFKSAISVTPTLVQVLPVDPNELQNDARSIDGAGAGTAKFEPSPEAVFNALVPRLVRCRVRQACLDAKASEHGSRMTAMDNATRNAKDLIQELALKYNKLRQGRITAELLDIIGGAEAQN